MVTPGPATTATTAILDRLRRLAARVLHLDLPEPELAGLSRLDEVTALDSLAVVEFAVAVEREFDVTLAGDDLRRATVADLPLLAARIARIDSPRC